MSSLFSIGWSDFSQRSARWWTPDDRERENPEAYGSLLEYLEATVFRSTMCARMQVGAIERDNVNMMQHKKRSRQ